jgi:hypothetical protein
MSPGVSEEYVASIFRVEGLPHPFTLVSCSAYFCTLKMEVICATKTSVDFRRTRRRYIPEHILRNHRYENLNYYAEIICLRIYICSLLRSKMNAQL